MGKRDSGRHHEKIFDSLAEQHAVKSTADLIVCIRDQVSQRSMTYNATDTNNALKCIAGRKKEKDGKEAIEYKFRNIQEKSIRETIN